MLAISRLQNESIKINDDVTIYISEITGHKVRLGIDAPAHVSINRTELYHEKLRTAGRTKLPIGPVTLVKCFNSQFMPDDIAEAVLGDIREDTTCLYISSELQKNCPDLYNWFMKNGAVAGDRVIVERGSWTN